MQAAKIIISSEEKRQLIAVVYWNPETDTLDFDAIDQIPFQEVQALLRQYLRGVMKDART